MHLQMTNAEIARCVRKAQDGCHESFGWLIARQEHVICGIIYNKMRDGSKEDREDMFQEVMLHAWRNIKLIEKDPFRFPLWMTVLTQWRCIAAWRNHPFPKQFEYLQTESMDRILSIFFMHEENFMGVIFTREAVDYVKRAMYKLSKMDRCMLKSRFWLRESQIELGKKLGVSTNTCRKRHKKAVGNFRQAFLQMVAPEDLYEPS